ncbi:hypothetical protein CGCSCA4_v013478 [Colletotrichum siamense]|uniref:Uncharacterized protein n=1 Tax=Colletotrichum siamense TaxID=690259 RepID=A0A9P5BV85_COLSI|nr:hypothetical protein CGCSCA4_v013478 [Colletotrichum siamense]KAF4846184.1 hypothetical protein CGCSCA2_v013202 [Colletotrichum siamense]
MGTAYLMRRRAPPALPSRWRLRWCFAGIPEAYHLVRHTANTTCLPVSQRIDKEWNRHARFAAGEIGTPHFRDGRATAILPPVLRQVDLNAFAIRFVLVQGNTR